jgi:hypothetical protein
LLFLEVEIVRQVCRTASSSAFRFTPNVQRILERRLSRGVTAPKAHPPQAEISTKFSRHNNNHPNEAGSRKAGLSAAFPLLDPAPQGFSKESGASFSTSSKRVISQRIQVNG